MTNTAGNTRLTTAVKVVSDMKHTKPQKIRKELGINRHGLCGGKSLEIASNGYEKDDFKLNSKKGWFKVGTSTEHLKKCTKCGTTWWGSVSNKPFVCLTLLWDGIPLQIFKKSSAYKQALEAITEGGE